MSTPSTAAEKPKRRVWHFVPYYPKLSEQVSLHVDSCVAAISRWVEQAKAGERSAAFVNVPKFPENWQHGQPLPPSYPKDDDDVKCDLTVALMGCHEWDGFTLAVRLTYQNWPADAELVQALHRWSCDLRRNQYAVYKASKDAKSQS
jgi:hypothetical protein